MHSQAQTRTMKAGQTQPRWDTVTWEDGYGVGHDGIDGDHRRLFELFNEFVTAVNDNRTDSDIENVLIELLEYCDNHFDREEKLMREFAYPEYEAHKAMHDAFVRQVHDVNNALDSGGEQGAYVLGFLGKWLSGHILGVDKKLGAYLRDRSPSA